MKKIVLLAILVLAFVLRLYRINFPLADWHSWRQADTSAVSRNLIKNGFDLLHPRFDDLSNMASKKDNPQGYRFVEFPIYNFFQALAFKIFPIFSLEIWGRLISILFSLGSLIFLYLIAEKYLGTAVGLWAAFFYAVLPFNIYYSRVILPEPMMIFSSLGMLLFFDNHFLFIFFAALTFLLKPFALVLLLPIVYLNWQKWPLAKPKWVTIGLSILVSLLPFLLWRWWMSRYPEGVPNNAWLFNSNGIRFKGAWFYWLFADRIGRLILGYWGLILFALGLIVRPNKKEGLFFYSWLAAILIFFSIVAAGNVQHDYYQVLAIPIICIFLAKGSYFLLTASSQYFQKIICHLLFVICLLFLFAFSWYQVRDFFNINNPAIVETGKAVDQLVPKNATVIAPYSGDTAFLYQTNRRGWPIWLDNSEIIRLKPDYFVSVNITPQVEELIKNYCLVQRTPNWVIIDLTKTCSSK